MISNRIVAKDFYRCTKFFIGHLLPGAFVCFHGNYNDTMLFSFVLENEQRQCPNSPLGLFCFNATVAAGVGVSCLIRRELFYSRNLFCASQQTELLNLLP